MSLLSSKAHPHDTKFESLFLGINASNKFLFHCVEQNLTKFERAILLIRNPYDSIWADYQRSFSRSHSGHISKATFKYYHWLKVSLLLAQQYVQMWDEYAKIKIHLKPTDYIFSKYELLQNPATRRAELRGLVNFIGIEPNNWQTVRGFNRSSITVTDEQLDCAFVLADKNSTHRIIKEKESDVFMTKEMAYTKPLICCMWAIFGVNASEVGYTTPYLNVGCEPDQAQCIEKLLLSARTNSSSSM